MVIARTHTGMGDVGMGGPTGSFLYNWLPDWALGVSCDNANRADIVSGSACDLYLKKMDALYPPPPMPVTPLPPVDLPENPYSREQAQAAVDAVVQDTRNRQQQQNLDWARAVAAGIDEYENRQAPQQTNLLFWGLAAVAAIWLIKR